MRMVGGGVWNTAPGQVTDDGELTLALAHALVGESTYRCGLNISNGESGMEEVDLTTWEEFEQRIEQLACKRSERKFGSNNYISEYLFRGQPSSKWSLTTTLERNAGRLLTLEEYYRIVCATKPQVETRV